FNIKEDPHEQHDLAQQLPEKVHEGACILEKWIREQMRINAPLGLGDPIWTVLGEGGGYHSLGAMPGYLDRLEKTGRSAQAQALLEKYPQYKDKY
ncbi:MAG: sulfatase, partial [Clostridiales bacterium]|nr:sulfatase [Clostridiales bacterium]